ncbi:16077_t:CDS:1, partial [Racocetra persica]
EIDTNMDKYQAILEESNKPDNNYFDDKVLNNQNIGIQISQNIQNPIYVIRKVKPSKHYYKNSIENKQTQQETFRDIYKCRQYSE